MEFVPLNDLVHLGVGRPGVETGVSWRGTVQLIACTPVQLITCTPVQDHPSCGGHLLAFWIKHRVCEVSDSYGLA